MRTMGKAKIRQQRTQQILQSLLPPKPALGGDKKLRILEATISIMASEGIEKVTFESVGFKLGTTKANIRYHFKNKDDLIFMSIKLMVMTAQQITKELVETSITASERVDAIINGAYQHLKDYPDHVRVFMMYFYYSSFQAEYSQYFINNRLIGQDRLKLILADLPSKNKRSKDVNLNFVADEIQNLITGQIIGMVLLNRPWSVSLNRTKKMISAHLEIEGIQWAAQ